MFMYIRIGGSYAFTLHAILVCFVLLESDYIKYDDDDIGGGSDDNVCLFIFFSLLFFLFFFYQNIISKDELQDMETP